MAGRGTAATELLTRRGIPHTVHSYEHDPRHGGSYGVEASEALGVPPGRVLKTLIADVDGTLTVGVVPVAAQLDLKALAAAVGGKKAAMADVTAMISIFHGLSNRSPSMFSPHSEQVARARPGLLAWGCLASGARSPGRRRW